AVPEDHEALGVGVGKGPEKERVGDAEDRGVRADAEAERQDGGEREAGALAEGTERVSKILDDVLRHAGESLPDPPERGAQRGDRGGVLAEEPGAEVREVLLLPGEGQLEEARDDRPAAARGAAAAGPDRAAVAVDDVVVRDLVAGAERPPRHDDPRLPIPADE